MRVSVLCLFLVSGVFVSEASARMAIPGDTVVQLAAAPRLMGASEDFPGMWEYVYDVVGTVDAGGQNHGWTNEAWLEGFDSSLMANRWTDAGVLWDGTGTSTNYVPKQNWTAMARGIADRYAGGYIRPERWPSLGVEVPSPGGPSALQWVQPKDVLMTWDSISYLENANPAVVNQAWYADNPWHEVAEYTQNESVLASSEIYAGGAGIRFTSIAANMASFYGVTGLMMTFRVVHPNAPGDISWGTYHNNDDVVTGTIIGPGVPEPATMSLLALGGLAVLRRRKK